METLTDRHSFFAVINFVIELNDEDFSLIENNMKGQGIGIKKMTIKIVILKILNLMKCN